MSCTSHVTALRGSRATLDGDCWPAVPLLKPAPSNLWVANISRVLPHTMGWLQPQGYLIPNVVLWGLFSCYQEVPFIFSLPASCIPVIYSGPGANPSQISQEDLQLLLAIPHPAHASAPCSLRSAGAHLLFSQGWMLTSSLSPEACFSALSILANSFLWICFSLGVWTVHFLFLWTISFCVSSCATTIWATLSEHHLRMT